MRSSHRYLELGTPGKALSDFFLSLKLFESFIGSPLTSKQRPLPWVRNGGYYAKLFAFADRFRLVSKTRAVNLDDVRDKQKEGIHHLQRI